MKLEYENIISDRYDSREQETIVWKFTWNNNIMRCGKNMLQNWNFDLFIDENRFQIPWIYKTKLSSENNDQLFSNWIFVSVDQLYIPNRKPVIDIFYTFWISDSKFVITRQSFNFKKYKIDATARNLRS